MAREQIAGAIILDRLRERIISGRYLGYWGSGERLPSIREIADAEQVDRKTAAAAYRRLQEEGLVRVRARSGIYLCIDVLPEPAGPLERLHRQWLEHTYEGARALGLDTPTIIRLIGAVAEIERLRLPVVESDWTVADAIAAELRERLNVRAMPYLVEELRSHEPSLADAPVVVTTPYHLNDAVALAQGRPVVEASVSPELLRSLRSRLGAGRVLLVVANDRVLERVRTALAHCGLAPGAVPLELASAGERAATLAVPSDIATAFLWPGTPAWVQDALPADLTQVRPGHWLADDAVGRVQVAVLDAAIRRVRGAGRAEEARAI